MAEHTFAGLRCSDVLEASGSFVLGALPAAEADAVRAHLAACPEAHAEVAELGSVLPPLFEAVEPVAPPASLRDRIMAAAAAEQAAMGSAAATASDAAARAAAGDVSEEAAPASTLKGFPAAVDTQRDLPRAGAGGTDRRDERYPSAERYPAGQPQRGGWTSIFRRPIWAPVALAAALAVVALGAWNAQLRTDLDALVAYRNGVVAVLDEASKPGSQLAVLTPPEGGGGPSGLAAVAPDGRVALVMRDLAPTTGTQVYETWLIGSDGKPIPIGGFRVASGGAATFTADHPAIPAGATVALTLEDAPGATTPKLPIVVIGAASQSS